MGLAWKRLRKLAFVHLHSINFQAITTMLHGHSFIMLPLLALCISDMLIQCLKHVLKISGADDSFIEFFDQRACLNELFPVKVDMEN
jgi:hypothetical protein